MQYYKRANQSHRNEHDKGIYEASKMQEFLRFSITLGFNLCNSFLLSMYNVCSFSLVQNLYVYILPFLNHIVVYYWLIPIYAINITQDAWRLCVHIVAMKKPIKKN